MTNILVTGGSGFLGSAIVKELCEPSVPFAPGLIRIFDLKEPAFTVSGNIEFVQGDIRDYPALLKALDKIDLVIHSAAVVDWGMLTEEEVLEINVTGTKNVIRACIEQKIHHLVYTSSLDAVFTGKPLVNINEDQPYPKHHHTSYCASKRHAEEAMIEANGTDLRTVIIRPSDIYGEADPFHIGSLINMAKGGFYVRLGNDRAHCQHVYVRNIAWAHLLAAHALLQNNSKVFGQKYFITDAPGSNFFRFFDRIVEGAGYRIWPKNLWIPRPLAMFIGACSEFVAVAVRPFKKYQPKFSRFAVIYTCTDFTFTSDKAATDFGFRPKYSEEEAYDRTIAYYRNAGM